VSEADSNARVNAWLLERFRAADEYWRRDEAIGHLRRCSSTRVVACEHGWECCCYSEYTRDDEWRIAVHLACDDGVSGEWDRSGLVWGDLPELIAAIKDADLDDFECPYDEEE
jgi:hypothetical protein